MFRRDLDKVGSVVWMLKLGTAIGHFQNPLFSVQGTKKRIFPTKNKIYVNKTPLIPLQYSACGKVRVSVHLTIIIV